MIAQWLINIQTDAPEGFRSCSVTRTDGGKLFVSILCRTWDELPDLRRQAERKIETGDIDIKPLQ